MKKIIAALAFFIGFTANAGLISVSVSNPNVAVGESIEVSVTGSGFDLADFLSFALEYDTSLFAFDTASLSGVLLDASTFLYEVNEEFYGLAVYWDNYGDFVEINAPLVAVKFNLIALAAGTTGFDMVDLFASEDVDFDSQTPVFASASAVSAPAAIGLFAVALFGLVGLRRKA